jgi:hypothetical protein
MTMQQKIAPCLWFEKEAEEAASFYTSIFPDSYIEYAATTVHRRIGETPGPCHDLLPQAHLDNGVAGNQLLGLRERTVHDGGLAAVVLDPPAAGARLQARGVTQDAGSGHLLVERAPGLSPRARGIRSALRATFTVTSRCLRRLPSRTDWPKT